MAGRVKRIGFDDQTITGGIREKPEKYTAKAGQTDVIRIMTDPLVYYGANVKKQDGEGFFLMSLADVEDIEANNTKACAAKCNLFRRGYKIVQRFVCLVHHIGRIDPKRNRFVKIDRFLPMSFGGERYTQLRSLVAGLPKKDEKTIPLRAFELLANCTDEQFQKLTFQVKFNKDANTVPYSASKEGCSDLFDPPGDIKGECSLLSEFLEPEPFNEQKDSLDRAEGKGRYAADAAGGDDVEADLDEGLDDETPADDAGDNPEPEPEAVRPTRPKSGAKPGAAPAARTIKPTGKPAVGKPGAKSAAGKPKPKPAAEESTEDTDLGEDFNTDDLEDLDV